MRSFERGIAALKPGHSLDVYELPGVSALLVGMTAILPEVAARTLGLDFRIDDEPKFFVSLDAGGRRCSAEAQKIGDETPYACMRRILNELKAKAANAA